MAGIDVRLVSSASFPFDPRYEQMRTKKAVPSFRVFGSRKRDQSRLLNLPDEILWRITEFVADAERGRFLSQFALVHRECRQLARPHQFADMFITSSEKSKAFLRHVLWEVKQDKSELAGCGLGLPIGACVRSLSLTMDDALCDEHEPLPADELKEWCKYWNGLMDDLAQAIESAMPNLERMYWRDTAILKAQPTFGAVLRSSCIGRLHELALTGYSFGDEELDRAVDNMPPEPIPLRSFSLGYDDSILEYSNRSNGSLMYLADNVLRRCAPTLESFAWNSDFRGETSEVSPGGVFTSLDGAIKFPKLQKFWAAADSYVDIQPSVMESILAAPLKSFSPSAGLSSLIMDNKSVEKFPLSYLRTFAIAAVDLPFPMMIDYVEQVFSLARLYARQIQELFIYLQGSVDQLASHLSGGSFCNLRSLCFSWVEDPDFRILKAIGSSLVTLEELSFGFQPAPNITAHEDGTWHGPISHDGIIAAILPLRKLVRLGVLGDEYIADWCPDDWAWHRYYKEFVWFNQGRSFCRRAPGQSYAEGVWGHYRIGDKAPDARTLWLTNRAEDPRSAMVEIARKYAMALPRLQGFVCGRIMIEIVGRETGED